MQAVKAVQLPTVTILGHDHMMMDAAAAGRSMTAYC